MLCLDTFSTLLVCCRWKRLKITAPVTCGFGSHDSVYCLCRLAFCFITTSALPQKTIWVIQKLALSNRVGRRVGWEEEDLMELGEGKD